MQWRAWVVGDDGEELPYQRDAGVVDRASQRGGKTRTTGLRSLRKSGIAELELHAVHPQPENLGRQLSHDGVGAGADVGRAAGDLSGAVTANCRAHLALETALDEGRASHAVADQAAPVAHRADRLLALCPAEPLGAHLVALA